MEQLRKFLERRARALDTSGRSLEFTRELTREKRPKEDPVKVISPIQGLVLCEQGHIGYIPVHRFCPYQLLNDINRFKILGFALSV